MLTFINTNDYKESIALHQNLLPRARKKGDKRREVVHYNSIGNAYYSLGSLDEALLYFQKDYDLSAEIGDKVGVATTLSSMSNVHKQKGDFDKATASPDASPASLCMSMPRRIRSVALSKSPFCL